MAIAIITAWLKDTNKIYAQGELLYAQFGSNALLKSLFKSGNGNSNYHRNRLISELDKLNATLEETPEAPAQVVLRPVTPVEVRSGARYSLTDPEWEKAPEAIKDLYVLNGELKSRADLTFHMRRTAQSDAERLQLSLSELNDRDQINDNWRDIKAYHATGKVTEKIIAESTPAIDELSMRDLTAILKNYPTYITKDRAKLKTLPVGSKRDKVAARLQEREVQLKIATERMKNV